MPSLTAAVYARKSTDQSGVADDAKSVTRQVERARAYAGRHGWIVADAYVFVDDGISGAEFLKRPGFLRLMNALKPRPAFQVLIMSEESRLGREAIETAYALKQLVTAGVRVFFYLEDRERTLESPTDKIMMSLTAFADELEREKARQRTYDALSRKAQAGFVAGGRTFGYSNVRDAAGVRRVIHPLEAVVVERMFRLAAEGRGLTSIAKILNADGALTPRAQQGRPAGWAPSSVREVLHRRLYRGEITWNLTKKRDNWGVKRQAPRAEAEWMSLPAPELTIVDAALWEAAHRQMAVQRARYDQTTRGSGSAPWGTDAKYLLTGLLRCAECGAGLEARSRKASTTRRVFYGCSAWHRRGTTVCTNSLTVPVEAADGQVLSALKETLLDPNVIGTAVERAVTRIASPPDCRTDVAVELRAIELELARLADAVATGGDVPALVGAIRSREIKRRELLSLQRARVVPGLEPDQVRLDLEHRLDDWRGLLSGNTANARRLVKQLLVGRLDMTPHRDEGYYDFKGTGTVLPLIAGVVPQSVASPPGFDSLWYLDLAGVMSR